ncbi:hypothetical protein FB451DRAFT_1363155 [Mycena latifolia]|nr:hypothetical protein FB451DRAFT_1363155 [Mycena latifolia]
MAGSCADRINEASGNKHLFATCNFCARLTANIQLAHSPSLPTLCIVRHERFMLGSPPTLNVDPKPFKTNPYLKEPDLELPNELWADIFERLENPGLRAMSRVNRAFNALAIPIYLARYGIVQSALYAGDLKVPGYRRDVFLILRTAFSLPPIRNLTCGTFRFNQIQILRFLRSFIAQHRTLEEIHLTLYGDDLFNAKDRMNKRYPRRTVQQEICLLLNSLTRGGRAVIIAGDRGLVSGSERRELWQMVRQAGSPPRGIRDKIRKALALKKRLAGEMDVVLDTACEIEGIMWRDSHTLDVLRSIDIRYSGSPNDWTVVTLNSGLVSRFNLTPALNASDWARVLPLLNFRWLEDFSMGRPTIFGNSDLRDVSMADLDTFLVRHPTIVHLEYVPQLSPAPLDLPEFSLASLPSLMHLTTTPVHFIRLHSAPNTFLSLTELILFSPPSMPVDSAQKDFTAVLHLLAGSDRGEAQSLCLHFPGAWIGPSLGDVRLTCVEAILIFGEFPLDIATLAEFLAPFEPGLLRVELHPTKGSMFERKQCVDKLRWRFPWLEDVSCSRVESAIQTVSRSRKREKIPLYSHITMSKR